jgi:hypothetical protein
MGDYSNYPTKPGFIERRLALASDYARKLAEKQWEGCHGCDENDKYFWINGFVSGYMTSIVEESDKFNCKYCGGEDKGQ